VGTLDQALLGVLPTRYNTMRLAGLADRVLIVDEAHSYEPYTEEMLQTLLTHQAMIGGSAVVMTATLPLRLREALLSAWARGRSATGTIDPPRGYPSLTLADADGEAAGTPVAPVPETVRRIAVTRHGSFEEACGRLLTAAARGAACVWVRNAVDEAIAAAETLRAQGAEVDLLHARFALCDRQAREEEALAHFGKDRAPRPGRILVATQVVEASLDLDFDVMVSDLAPIGALVQRAGRLWRHMDRRPRDDRPVEGPCLDVLSPDPEGPPGERWLDAALGKGAFVYPLDVQWRTARALFRTGEIAAPDGLRDLIEAVHGAEAMPVPEALTRAEAEREGAEWAERGRARQNVIALEDGYPAMPGPDPNEALATRLGRPQIALVLARRTETGVAFWSADPDPRRAEALSEVQLARAHWHRLGEPRDQDAETALTPHWKDWDRAQKAVVVVEPEGGITQGLHYSGASGLVIDPG
jgi:CRISPR-associated endonuclease/helicase Cas3